MPHNILNSVLRYNGIDIPYVKTEVFRQEPILSNDGTDLLYLHITIGVSGVLNECFLGGADPACWIESNRPALLQRGGQLWFYIGGIQVLPPDQGVNVEPSTGVSLVTSPAYTNPADCLSGEFIDYDDMMDAKLGPRPIRLDVRGIHGTTLAIYYEIETWVPYCYDGTPLPILSNRWESSLTIDKDYYYTRTTTGILVLNGQNMANVNAQAVLGPQANALLIFPPLAKLWKREVIRCVLSSDNLTLAYTIEDKQQYVSTPRPAVEVEASYVEISPAHGEYAIANMIQCNCDVTVKGDPSTLYPNSYPTQDGSGQWNPDRVKYALLSIMWQYVFSRIKFPFQIEGAAFGKVDASQNNQWITHCKMREDMVRPIVGCSIASIKSRPSIGNIFGAASGEALINGVFNATCIGQPLLVGDIENQISTQPVAIGNWATFFFLQSILPKFPCESPDIPTAESSYQPFTTAVYTTQIASTQTNIGTAYTQTNNLSFSNQNYLYPFTDYTATVDYPTDNHILQLPIMYDVEQDTPGTTQASSVFCQTASPTSKKIVHWKACRVGSWPLAPALNSLDVYGDSSPKDRVLRTVFSTSEVELTNDGLTRKYFIAGMTEIGMARRLQWDVASTVLSTICNQIIGSSIYGDKDASFPTNNFIAGILDAGPAPGN